MRCTTTPSSTARAHHVTYPRFVAAAAIHARAAFEGNDFNESIVFNCSDGFNGFNGCHRCLRVRMLWQQQQGARRVTGVPSSEFA